MWVWALQCCMYDPWAMQTRQLGGIRLAKAKSVFPLNNSGGWGIQTPPPPSASRAAVSMMFFGKPH